MKPVRHALEAFFALLIYGILRALPLDVASAFGGWVASRLGPCSKVHRVAQHNLHMAMPELSGAEQHTLLQQMWEHMGRIFGEYAHLPTRTMDARIHVTSGEEYLQQALREQRSIVFVSAHLGNWECLPIAANRLEAPVHLLYRPANNTIVEWLVTRLRKPYSPSLHAKGQKGARAIIRAVRSGEHVAMLMDQKTNDGMAISFFGHDAMTSTVAAQLAVKYNVVLLPCYCVRRQGAQFDIHVEAPIDWQPQATTEDTLRSITTQINARIEAWVRAYPAQWFWVHKRWPHSKRKGCC